MKFLLNLYLDPALLAGEGHGGPPGHEEFRAMVRESGELVGGEAVADPSTGAVVRVRDGGVAVTEGPYLGDGEHLVGYYLVDCESRERALELAALVPGAGFGGVEVRPLMDSSGMEM